MSKLPLAFTLAPRLFFHSNLVTSLSSRFSFSQAPTFWATTFPLRMTKPLCLLPSIPSHAGSTVAGEQVDWVEPRVLGLDSKVVNELDRVAHVFRRQKELNIYELKASLVYIASSGQAKAT